MATIFISYSRRDKHVIVDFLEPRIHNIYGYASLWYDKSIPGGDDWWQRIVTEIRNCEVILFLMSDNSVDSKYCRKELDKAIYNQKTILPILLPNYTHDYPATFTSNLADYMATVHYLDYREGFHDFSLLWGAINRVTDRSVSRSERWLLYNQYEILRILHSLKDDDWNHEYYEQREFCLRVGHPRVKHYALW